MNRLLVEKQCPLAATVAGVLRQGLRHACAPRRAGKPQRIVLPLSPAHRRQVRSLLLAYVGSILNTAVILMMLAETDLGLRFTTLGLL